MGQGMEAVHGMKEDVMSEVTSAAASWEDAEVGDLVRLEKPGWPPRDGFVEDKTSSGDIVWVVSAGERRLFHKADGYSLTVRN
jgi:hypothetical protein